MEMKSLLIALCVCTAVLAIVSGLVMTRVVQAVEAQKAERYQKELPYATWGISRTSVLCAVFLLCGFLCLFSSCQSAITWVASSVLVFIGISCAVIDVDMRLIPNQLVLAVAVFGAALRLGYGTISFFYGLLVAAIVFALFLITVAISKALRGTTGMGAGDLKLIVAVCFAVGWPGVCYAAVGFGVSVLAMCAYQLFYLRCGLTSAFPMAPAIVVGLLFGVIGPGIQDVNTLMALDSVPILDPVWGIA